MKGVLDFLLGSSSEAEELLNGHVFKIAPMLNPPPHLTCILLLI
jgi:hypothetical protein